MKFEDLLQHILMKIPNLSLICARIFNDKLDEDINDEVLIGDFPNINEIKNEN